MNRILTFLSLCIVVLTATAQTVIKEMDGANTRFIPGQYMKNCEAAIYFSGDEYGYDDLGYQAKIFDFELNPLKTFDFPIIQPYVVFTIKATTGTIEKTKSITYPGDKVYSDIPDINYMDARKTAFFDWLLSSHLIHASYIGTEDLIAGCRVDGTTIIVRLNCEIGSGRYSNKYSKYAEINFYADDRYDFTYLYAIEVPLCNGETLVNTTYDYSFINFCTPRCHDVAKMNHWNGGLYLPFSQTFFNDDESFEYVRYRAEIAKGSYGGIHYSLPDLTPDVEAQELFGVTPTDRDGDGVDDYVLEVYGISYTGLEVVDENGNVIYSFPIPDNCEGDAHVEFFKSDNHILAQVDYDWTPEDKKAMHTVRFYRIDKSSGIAEVVKEENHISPHPNPASKGTPIEMTLPASNSPRTINITSLNGTQVFTMPIAPDATHVLVPTSNLTSGMYMFSVIENGRTSETCKIIVR